MRFRAPPDFEMPADAGANNVYDVTVQASDSGGATGHDVTVTVTDVDAAATITSNSGAFVFPYDENATTDVAAFSATDPERPADNDNNQYLVQVRAMAGAGDPVHRDVVVNVTNTDEDGVLALSSPQLQVGRARASMMLAKSSVLRHSSLSLPLKDSMKGVSQDDPGSM